MTRRPRRLSAPAAGTALTVLVLLLLCCTVDPAAAATRYVLPGGALEGDCASWATACELRQAISLAIPGDEIWVAVGTYLPTGDDDRTVSFVLKSGVAIYGGFAGTETSREQRDQDGDATILSGDIGAAGDAADNSYHVVVADGVDETAILDGFVVIGGNADGASPHCEGGGLRSAGGSPTLRNLEFRGNAAVFDGGGVYTRGGSPAVSECAFVGNSAGLQGGGIYTLKGSPVLTNVTFSGNVAGLQGGGIYSLLGAPVLKNVTSSGNDAFLSGGGLYGLCSEAQVGNSIFWGNADRQIVGHGPTMAIDHSIVEGGCPEGGGCTDVLSDDPLLGGLGDNGGFTPTMALLSGSPALDSGEDASCPPTDQRGIARPLGPASDIGAYEAQLSQTITVTLSAPAKAAYGASFAVAATADSGLDVAISALGSCNGSGSGSATVTMIASAGVCTITYTQDGDGGYLRAEQVTEETDAERAATTTAITSHNPDPSAVGAGVTVDVSVASVAGDPTGTVTVGDGEGHECTMAAPAGSCVLIPDSAGMKTLTAVYAGDANFYPSSSAGTGQDVRELRTLAVSGAGVNGGTMQGGDIISCSWNGQTTAGTCAEVFLDGFGPVHITASALAGRAVRWGGGCDATSGDGSMTAVCVVQAMNADKAVQARFAPFVIAPPRKLVAAALEEERVKLTWVDASDNEQGFRVWEKGPDGKFGLRKEVGAGTTSCTVSGLAPGEIHTFAVTAWVGSNESVFSNEASVALLTPDAPGGLRVLAVSPSAVVAAWTDRSSIEEGFTLQRKPGGCQSAGVWAALSGPIGADTEEYLDDSLAAGARFSYRVKAVNGSGESGYSNCSSARTGAADTPHAPTHLVAAAMGGGKVALSWEDASSDETSFRIFRGKNWGRPILLHTAGEGETAYEDNAAPGSTATIAYRYYLRSCNAIGCSPSTAIARVPKRPASSGATPGEAGGIVVRWAGVDRVARNVVIYRKSGDCSSPDSWVEIARPAKSPGSFLDTGVTGGDVYSYMLSAVRESLPHPQAWGYSAGTACSSATAP